VVAALQETDAIGRHVVDDAMLVRQADACILVGRYRSTALNAVSRTAELIPADCPTGFVMTQDTSRVPGWISRLL